MSRTDELVEANARYAERFEKSDLPIPPAKRAAVVTCMDARLETGRMLGLEEGDAHVIRNAGGIVTEDVIRSLMISQHLLGTREVIVIRHTGCGMLTFTDAELEERVENETGVKPPFPAGAFADLELGIRESLERIRSSPFLAHSESVRGFVYDVKTGLLREVA